MLRGLRNAAPLVRSIHPMKIEEDIEDVLFVLLDTTTVMRTTTPTSLLHISFSRVFARHVRSSRTFRQVMGTNEYTLHAKIKCM